MTDEEEDGTGREGEKGRNWSDCAGREGGGHFFSSSFFQRKEKKRGATRVFSGGRSFLIPEATGGGGGGVFSLSRSFFLPLLLLPVIVATFGNAGKWRDWQREKGEREERVSKVDDWCGIRRLNAERKRFLIGNSNPTCDHGITTRTSVLGEELNLRYWRKLADIAIVFLERGGGGGGTGTWVEKRNVGRALFSCLCQSSPMTTTLTD